MVKLVGTSWTQVTGGAGFNTIFTGEKMTYYVSRSADGSNPIAIRPDMLIGYDGAVPIYIKGATESSYVVVSDAFRSALSRATGGGGGTSYTFNAPLSESGGIVDLNISSDFIIDGNSGALTLNLLQNQNFKNLQLAVSENSKVASLTEVGRVQPKENDFKVSLDGLLSLDTSATGTLGIMQSELDSLKLRLNRMTYPQFDNLEVNITPEVIKKGKFSLGDISPSAAGTIPLRNGATVMQTFGTEKTTAYTSSDIAYNSQEGFFYIGRNNRLVHLYTDGLLNSKLTEGKYTMQFTFEITEFANSWKNPVYIQVNGAFSTVSTDGNFKDNSNRIEFGNQTSTSPETRACFAYNWRGNTTAQRSVTLPDLPVNTKISGVAVYDGNTCRVYTRQGDADYTLQGSMDVTIPTNNNILALGFVRGGGTSGDCASIKIYEVRLWVGSALTEAEVLQLKNVSMEL